jgi:LytS/YehU family sensor histidine kinase
MILPKVNQKFWYIVSFIFSFSSGFFGFLFSFAIFSYTDFVIVKYINNYWFYIAVTIGFLTFLVGLILHQFISMKYKNESIKTEILETKLKALENELNPHFLFNALNSVSELIYVDQDKAEKAVLHISKFLRNAINKDSLVSIETELSMVNTYVNIENIRFNNRIKLTTTVEENMKAVLIPKFSIQLLVENAIKHGYKTVDLNIDINAYDEIIEVSNDGKISHNINYGTGLSNLDKRLEIQSIGRLTYDVKDDRMKFIIKLKKGK